MPAVPAVRGVESRDPVEELLVRSQSGVTLGTMIDELVDELFYRLSREDPTILSPMAIRLVHLSPNLRPSLAQTIEAKVVARVGQIPHFEQVVCIECRSVRSRVEGDDWVVTMGASTQDDLARIGRRIGAKTFMELDLDFTQAPAELVLAAKIYRASDGRILWTSAIKGDETTAAVMRTGKRPVSREEQVAEFKRMLEQRPLWGYMFFVGVAYMSADGPQGGYAGINPGIRVYERFGAQRRHMFGFQGEGLLDFSSHTLLSGMLSAGYWVSVLPHNLHWPDVRVGALVGGFISGTDGNSGIFQICAEAVLQFRLAVSLAASYMIPTKYGNEDLGGFGAMARIAFNW